MGYRLRNPHSNYSVMPQPKAIGVSRSCRTFAHRLEKATNSFPAPHDPRGYWHLHLPLARSFIDAPTTPQPVRRECVQLLLDAAFRLSKLRPQSVSARVVAAISTPKLFDSQLIAFFSTDYFESFFHRDSLEQKWAALPPARSLVREWRLVLPAGLFERGFHEHICDDDHEQHGEIWFIGELS